MCRRIVARCGTRGGTSVPRSRRTHPRRVRARRRRVSVWMPPGAASRAAVGHDCLASVPGIGFVHRDRSLVLPFGTTVSARVVVQPCGVFVSFRACRRLAPSACGQAPLSIPARIDHRLGDGDNVVNTNCTTMHNRSQKSCAHAKTCSKCAGAQRGNVRKTDISRQHDLLFSIEKWRHARCLAFACRCCAAERHQWTACDDAALAGRRSAEDRRWCACGEKRAARGLSRRVGRAASCSSRR